ncbi:MAG: RagB/SusD family nutrient uptake outer membrane protein [Bacteroidales bacterium]
MKKYILLILFATSLFSCEDFLTREPVTSNSVELTLSDFDGMNKATIGAYSPLYSVNWYGASFPILADIKTDNAKSSPINTGRYQTDYSWIQDPANTSGLWATAYIAITSADNVLEALETYELKTGETQEQFDHLKAECLFIRALGHFDLVRLYAQSYSFDPQGPGVPIILYTRRETPPRNTISEVYNQVVADLLEAEPLFMDGFNEEYRPDIRDIRGVASKEAAQALLARVYLYMENWNEAANYASKVIASGNFELYTDLNYQAAWGADASPEVIMEVWGSYTQTNAPFWDEIGRMYSPDGYGDVCATNSFLALFEDGDVRAQMFVEPEDYQGYFWPTKYPGKGDLRQNNIPVFRLSEMYLIRAEAVLNGASGDALADYNAIRTNRGLSAATNVIADDIFDERRRELCFEGHLLFDYARLQKSLVRTDEDNRITGTLNVPFPSYLWAMPIPLSEMEANPNMVQNEGY